MRVYVLAATTALVAAPAWSADTPATPAPAQPAPVYDLRGSTDVSTGFAQNVYVKGQVSYLWPDLKGITYAVGGVTNTFDTRDVDDTWSVGAGVGYQISRYLRTELMFNYDFDSDFRGSTSGSCGVAANCVSTDISSWNAYSLIASLYVDLDFWGAHSGYSSIVPFVGGGIGGAYVDWDNLSNTSCEVGNPSNCDATVTHNGMSEWRFAYELVAGLSYKFRCDVVGEAAYKYKHYAEGGMFGNAVGGGPGYDDGFDIQAVQVGLRYYPGRDCDPPFVPPYVPPVYK